MSNYSALAIHPVTGKAEQANWLDNHFGRHRYGVQFPDGAIFPAGHVKTAHNVRAARDRAEIERLRHICKTIASGLRGQYATRDDMATLADSAVLPPTPSTPGREG